MIFVDSNIPMYLVGAAHENKAEAQRVLEQLIVSGSRLVTDVAALQEILQRYVAIYRRDAIQAAFDAALGVVDEVLTIEPGDVDRAKALIHARHAVSAREAIHVAVMQRHGISIVFSFNDAFDAVPGIERIPR